MNTKLIEVEMVRVELDIEYARLEVTNTTPESRTVAFEHLMNASKRLDCVEAMIKDAMGKLNDPWYNVSVEDLTISGETLGKLIEAKIETVDVLKSHSENDLIRLPNFGRKAINDVKAALLYRNLFLSGTDKK